MIRHRHRLATVLSFVTWLTLGLVTAQTPASNTSAQIDVLTRNGIVHELFVQTGVYNKSKTGKTPDFIVDPSWPHRLPHNWLLGQIGGLYVDRHDNIWVYQRPRTLTTEEAGLEQAVNGAKDASGQPVNGLGFLRVYGAVADCCHAAPSVLEFNAAGELLRSWGGPSDPGFIGGKCKEEDGCIWPNSEHGIYVDQNDDVWLAGNAGASGAAPAENGTPEGADEDSARVAGASGRGGAGGVAPARGGSGRLQTPWSTNKAGADGFVLEFDVNGNFKKRIGGTPKEPNSNDTDGGINGTPLLYQPTDMVIDAKTNRLYISDGYGNRHILVVDAATGKFAGSIGAYGNNPIDDRAARAAGTWIHDYSTGKTRPAFFRTPVHCVKIANDGKVYVCDRGNNRIQVFDSLAPGLGQLCSNPSGEPGRCGFVAEQFISEHTNTGIPGTSVSMSFSSDKDQSCLYVGDNSNMTIYILNRTNLQELGRLGRSGRMAGDFHWLHQVSVDSKGNIYTGEVDTGKRIQKFIRYGSVGCSGTGSNVVGGAVE
jgi:NHL repeat